ncbi:MAG: sigma-54-dependent transcriptional regulator [Dehalococcoidales bacterium]
MKKQTVQESPEITIGGSQVRPILIVEDEAIMRESLQDWLMDEGYQVETAERGEEALKVLAERDFGVVLLDMRLPGKDGLEVLREARVQSPQLKGIIITAYPSVETAVEAMKIGAIDYLIKPLDLDDLEKLIHEALGPVQVEIRPKAVTEEAVVEPTVAEEAKVETVTEKVSPRDWRRPAQRFTSLEGNGRLYPACRFEGSQVSKRLCIRDYQCYRCPFFDQITYEADVRRIQKIMKTREAEKVATKTGPVLIVEDEAIMRESLRDWLRDDGYEVETAEGGEEALQRMGEKDFGVVLLDMRLPGRDGLEVFKEARARRPQLKGIIITAYPSVETAVEAMKLGAVDYVVKPFVPDALEKLIRETLGPVQVEIKPKTAST